MCNSAMQSINCYTSLFFLLLSVSHGNKLPLKGTRHHDLPVLSPRILQNAKGGPPKWYYPEPAPTSWTWSPYPTTAGSVPPSPPPSTFQPTSVASSAAVSPTNVPKFPIPTSPTNAPIHEVSTTSPSFKRSTTAPSLGISTSGPTSLSACSAAANGAVFKTSHPVSLAYFYELLTVSDLNVSDVTSQVDKSVQKAMAQKLVGCSRRRRRRMVKGNITILGVEQDAGDQVVNGDCSTLTPPNGTDQVCYSVQSTITVYLKENNADSSLSTKVFQALSNVFDGNALVDSQAGIYGLAFVGANLPLRQPTDTSSSPNAVQSTPTVSSTSSGLSLTPGAVVVVAAVCLTVLVVAFFVFRRSRQWPAVQKARNKSSSKYVSADDAIKASSLEDEKSTPTANASFDREIGMFIEYDDDESNGYGKVLANRPILRDMDNDGPSPPTSQSGGWFSTKQRSPIVVADGESFEITSPGGVPAPSSKTNRGNRVYSVNDTIDF